MKIKSLIIFSTIFSMFCSNLFADFEKRKGEIKNGNIFAVKFQDGSSFFADATKVVSISMQEYVNEEVSISEIDIDAGASALIRIYCVNAVSDPVKTFDKNATRLPTITQRATEKVSSLAEQAKGNIPKQLLPKNMAVVRKNYPTTTHAKTIEYALADEDSLNSLYKLLVADYAGYEVVQKNKQSENLMLGNKNQLGGNVYEETSK